MRVRVQRIQNPAFSTLGYGYGREVGTGEEVCFCGDHRPMRDLGETLRVADDMPTVEIEPWQAL